MQKKMIIPMLAVIAGVVLAGTSSAFTHKQQHNFNPVWKYIGPAEQSQDELNSANNYDQTSISCGTSGSKVCTIQAPSDGASPAHPQLLNGDVKLSNPAYSPVSKL